MTDKLCFPDLGGVPETMLWPLYNRATEASRPDALLEDPEAVRIAAAIDYDYERSFGKPNFGHIIRARVIDDALRRWLTAHPGGEVVALGEGLDTQHARVDDGKVRWLSIDLPDAIDVRERFFPDTDRHRKLRCSALEFRWMDEVDAQEEIFVTMAGLLMYFEPNDVKRLIAGIAERFPRAEMIFDIIPRWFSKKTLAGWKLTEHYTLPPMPFGMDRNELAGINDWHRNIAEISEPPAPKGRGFLFRYLTPIIERTPWLKNKMPTAAHVRCEPASRSSQLNS